MTDTGTAAMTSTTTDRPKTVGPQSVPELAADLDAELRRLKLAAIRRTAPEVLLTAKTWAMDPGRSPTNPGGIGDRRSRCVEHRQSSRGRRVPGHQNVGIVRRRGVVYRAEGLLLPFRPGMASDAIESDDDRPGRDREVAHPHRPRSRRGARRAQGPILLPRALRAGRYPHTADLVETLYRGLADNTVGKIIESLLRVDLIIIDEMGFTPLDDTGTQLLFRLVAGAYERRSLAIGSHWPFEQWGQFLPEHTTTAASILDRLLHHATIVVTDGESYRMKDAQHRKDRP